MIKTVITPLNNNLSLEIPDNYVGKEVEILLYAKDELQENKSRSNKTIADFIGVLEEDDYQSLKSFTEQARKEWSRAI